MYLREMGGVELLSREGEIAIAKRIEAGKDVMLNALSQSPITAQQFFEWNTKLQNDEILVREIIDIDTNYMEDETTGPSAKQKNSGETDKEEGSSWTITFYKSSNVQTHNGMLTTHHLPPSHSNSMP